MLKKWSRLSFSKKIVIILLVNGVIWTYLSYALAFLNKISIAENLSEAVVVEILGVTLLYSVKATLENLSKNNDWPDKKRTRIHSRGDTTDITVGGELSGEGCESTVSEVEEISSSTSSGV